MSRIRRGDAGMGVPAHQGKRPLTDARECRLTIFLVHRPALVRLAAAIVGCRIRAEDVVQDSCMRFVCDEAVATDALNPAAYLQRMVRNLAFDHVRRRGAESRAVSGCAAACLLHPPTKSPEDLSLCRQDLRAACSAIGAMPPRQRRAFVLHRIYGLTFREIGEQIGVSTATAHRLTRDALTQVMASLEEQDS